MSGPNSVRSLLAKFENNAASTNNASTTSPPSRGRSPSFDPSGNPRPLSKVRASFVAVERTTQSSPTAQLWERKRPGELGDSPAKPFGMERLGSPIPIDRSATISPTSSVDRPPLGRPPSSSPPQFLAAIQNNENGVNKTKDNNTYAAGNYGQGLGNILKGSPFEDSKRKTELVPGSAQPKKDSTAPTGPKVEPKPKEQKAPKKETTTTTSKAPARPSNIAVGSKDAHSGQDATKRAPTTAVKSPVAPKTPKTPVKPATRQPSTTTNTPVAKKETERPSRVATKRPSTVRSASHPAGKVAARTKPQTSETNGANGDAKSSTHNSPNNTKPRPKSPTRPLRLPPSMTAYTAASAAKLNNATGTRPESRTGANGNTNTRKAPPARSSGAGLRPTTPGNTTIRKRASHATLAPTSHTTTTHERPRSRVSNAGSRGPDESFLARMMRPTASSASKMHERVEVKSPPRPTAKPPQRSDSGKKKTTTTKRTDRATVSPSDSQQTNGDDAAVIAAPMIEEPEIQEEPKIQEEGPKAEEVKIEEPEVSVEPDKPETAEKAELSVVEEKAGEETVPAEVEATEVAPQTEES